MWNFTQMMTWFSEHKGHNGLQGEWGIEREAQRVTTSGDLALTDHPAAFGNKLTNPYITTDFAESQLEMITPPVCSIEEVLAKLSQIHDEVECVLENERLWPLSMPPRLPSEQLIPIAKYDNSPEGQASAEYRRGLAERYGKTMQMISGLHINFSFNSKLFTFLEEKIGGSGKDFSNHIYFAMSRNFLRYRWLLIYLFGASPTVDPSYDAIVCDELDVIEQRYPDCSPHSEDYEKYATSLRVSRYGYSNVCEQNISMSFDHLDAHIAGFEKLLEATIANEREFYSPIRLKPPINEGEGYLQALKKHGVRYAEIRMMDLNPYVREGISLHQLRVFHVFMIWCLFEHSPPISTEEEAINHENHHKVSLFGRRPHLILEHVEQGKKAMITWMDEIFEKLKQVALLLDKSLGVHDYTNAIEDEYMKVNNIQLIPSARMINEMAENKECFLAQGIRLSEKNRKFKTAGCI